MSTPGRRQVAGTGSHVLPERVNARDRALEEVPAVATADAIVGLSDEGDVTVRIPKHALRAVLGPPSLAEPLAALVQAIEERLGPEQTEQVLHAALEAIAPPNGGQEQTRIAGMPLVPPEVGAAAAAFVAARSHLSRETLLADAISTVATARRLHMTRQGIAARIRRGDLLAIRVGKYYRLPAWQFDDHAEDGLVAGLPRVLHALTASSLAKARWLTRPSPYLGGETPLAVLMRGDLETVLAEARGVEAAGW